MLREVAVTQMPTGEFLAVDREPRRVGEVVTLETSVNAKSISTRMRVVATRPIVRNGSVCHELTLKSLQADDNGEEIR